MRKHRYFRLLGQRTAFYTAEIIKKFTPELWVIENGATSLIFKYLHRFHKLQGVKNFTYYNNYSDTFPMKPTIFFSNKKMHLKRERRESTSIIALDTRKCNIERATGEWERLGFSSPSAFLMTKYNLIKSYCDKSSVPIELYQHVLRIFEGKEQLSLF